MLNLTSVLALFTLLAIASGAYFLARRLKLPYTVFLVIIGLVLVPVVQLPVLSPYFGFLDDLALTPELLFYIFLPILIFESAFNMRVRQMVDSAWSIASLAIIGLLVSTVLIASALFYLLPLIGIDIPFIVALLFGAVISSTDPVAVLALFKDYGAPKRLSLMFEGESLFNDGTAVALFLVILAVAEQGFDGVSTVIEGFGMFVTMVVTGIVLGLLLGGLFSKALRYTKSNEFVSVTLLMISAHLVFIISEAISQNGLFGLRFHVSAIIATTVSSLFLGNYARHILSPRTDDYLEKSIEHLAFVANSLVFLLAGILFASTKIDLAELWLPILLTIVVVATARIIAVYAVIVPLNALKLEAPIPGTWRKLLAWGSLRGALAIIIVMLIPEDLEIAGWTLSYSPRDFILALTIGCILATLFIKALTIGPMIKRFKLDKPPLLEEAHQADLGVYYLLTEKNRFALQKTRGFVREEEYKGLKEKLSDKFDAAHETRNALVREHGIKLFERSLRLTAIDVEYHYLKELYVNEEVTEKVYRAIKGKLTLQREKIEAAQHDDIDPSVFTDRKDVFDRMMNAYHGLFDRRNKQTEHSEQLQYYRAQMIVARKALKTLDEMQTKYDEPIFIAEVYEKVVAMYQTYKKQAAAKMDAVLAEHPDELAGYVKELAERSLHASGVRAVHFLSDRGIVNEDTAHDIEQTYAI